MKTALWALGVMLAVCPSAAADSLIPADYREWEKLTDIPLNYPIPGHLDHYRIPYINRSGTQVSAEDRKGRLTYTYPKGTIIVKETYQGLETPKPGAVPILLYAMIKDPENPKARGGWIWVLWDVAAGTERVYESPLCFTCHSAANDTYPYGDGNRNREFRDYVFFPYVKKK